MKRQTRYFITGLILLIIACCCITLIPAIIKTFFKSIVIYNYIFRQVEFLLLVLCAILFLFCPKYYKFQMLSIGFCFLFYFAFVKLYPYLIKCFNIILSSFSL